VYFDVAAIRFDATCARPAQRLARTRSRSCTRIRGCASWGELRFIQNEADMPNSMDRARALIIADKQFLI
jgi:hypothetical protein